MALKKYRFFVGACGPTVMYSNIIRAEDEIAATKLYLAQSGKEITDQSIADALRNIREVIPKETPEKLIDFNGNVISEGNAVLFIKNTYGKPPQILSGTVENVTGKSIVVKTQSGESVRVMLPADEDEMLPRVLIAGQRPARVVEGVMDATGYPIQMGDLVAYMGDVYAGSCDGFRTGTVKKITAKTLAIDGVRKNFDRVVVINW